MPPDSHLVLLVGHLLDNPSIAYKTSPHSNYIMVRRVREGSKRGRLEKNVVIRE